MIEPCEEIKRVEQRYEKILDDTEKYYKDVLDKIRAEIEEKYGDYNICEWYEDYDYEENDTSEYHSVGDITDILQIIDKYKGRR